MKIVYSLSRENEDKVQSFWEGHKIWKKSSSENLTSKFVYSEKATKFCKICTLLLSTVHTDKSKVEICQILWPSQNIWTLLSNIKYKVEDFFKFCALLKKSELYLFFLASIMYWFLTYFMSINEHWPINILDHFPILLEYWHYIIRLWTPVGFFRVLKIYDN